MVGEQIVIPDRLRSAARVFGIDVAHVGPWRRLDVGRGPGQTWLLQHQAQTKIFRVHGSHRAYRQELIALTGWLADDARTPGVWGQCEPERVLGLDFVPGTRPRGGALAAFRPQVEAFVERLHRSPVEDLDPLPLDEAIGRRFSALRDSLRGVVDIAMPSTSCFAGRRRVPCHRDFTPGNWLVHDGVVRFIDFEHAHMDAEETDWVKLFASPVESAVVEAMTEMWAPRARTRLSILTKLHGMATLNWGQAHGDVEFVAEGRRILELRDPGWDNVWPVVSLRAASGL